MNNTVTFSIDQLFQCLPKEEGCDGCEGLHPKTFISYLMDVGLVEAKAFKNAGCESLHKLIRYRFAAIFPESPKAGGLMNLVAEERLVFVMIAVDLQNLRFVKDMSNAEKGVECSFYDPSLYGIVTGYKYDKDNIKYSWWEVTSYPVFCDEMILRMPMTDNMTNANYAGIAGYPFSLELLTIEEPIVTPTPTPTPIPISITDYCAGYLDVSNDSACESPSNGCFYRGISVSEGVCNSYDGYALRFTYNPCVSYIYIGNNTFNSVTALVLYGTSE